MTRYTKDIHAQTNKTKQARRTHRGLQTEEDRQKTCSEVTKTCQYMRIVKDTRYLPTYTTILSVLLLRYRWSVEFLLVPPC